MHVRQSPGLKTAYHDERWRLKRKDRRRMRRKGILAFLWRLTRTTSIVVGLAVMFALVAGVASLAVAQKPPEIPSSGSLLLGIQNTANAVTTLINSGTGAALNLQVAGTNENPPLVVNSRKLVEKLHAENADYLNGRGYAELLLPQFYQVEGVATPRGSGYSTGGGEVQ